VLVRLPGQRLPEISQIKERIKNLRNGCPDIRLLTTYESDGKLEKKLHAHFQAHHVVGEWFDLGINAQEKVDEYFADIC
jgi:hypothetical protein